MSALNFVTPDQTNEFWNVLLYGPGGNGKTVGACSAPGKVILVNGDGPDASRKAHAIYGDKIQEVVFEGARTLDNVYLHVTSKEGADVKTVVLDPIGEIYQGIFEELGGERKDMLKNHGDTQTKIERFVRSFRDLPINLVLVCHEEVADQEGETIRRPLTGGKKLPEKIVGMMSIVGYCMAVPPEPDKPEQKTRYVAQLVEARGRRAKDRSGGLGDSRDINLAEWFSVATEAIKLGEQLGLAAEENNETSSQGGGKEEKK